MGQARKKLSHIGQACLREVGRELSFFPNYMCFLKKELSQALDNKPGKERKAGMWRAAKNSTPQSLARQGWPHGKCSLKVCEINRLSILQCYVIGPHSSSKPGKRKLESTKRESRRKADKARTGSLQQLGVKTESKSGSTGKPWLESLSSDMQSLRNCLIVSKCSQFRKLTMLYHHPKMSTCVVSIQSLAPSS